MATLLISDDDNRSIALGAHRKSPVLDHFGIKKLTKYIEHTNIILRSGNDLEQDTMFKK